MAGNMLYTLMAQPMNRFHTVVVDSCMDMHTYIVAIFVLYAGW